LPRVVLPPLSGAAGPAAAAATVIGQCVCARVSVPAPFSDDPLNQTLMFEDQHLETKTSDWLHAPIFADHVVSGQKRWIAATGAAASAGAHLAELTPCGP
jgi:hypothetical protein